MMFHIEADAARPIISFSQPANHDEVRSGPECLGNVARIGAAPVANNMALQIGISLYPCTTLQALHLEAVRSVGTLEHCTQLGIADPCFLSCGANRARTDADFHYIGAGNDQLLLRGTARSG